MTTDSLVACRCPLLHGVIVPDAPSWSPLISLCVASRSDGTVPRLQVRRGDRLRLSDEAMCDCAGRAVRTSVQFDAAH